MRKIKLMLGCTLCALLVSLWRPVILPWQPMAGAVSIHQEKSVIADAGPLEAVPLRASRSSPKSSPKESHTTPSFELYPPQGDLDPHQMGSIKRTLELLRMIQTSKQDPLAIAPIQEALLECIQDPAEAASRQATCMRLLVEIDPDLEEIYLTDMQPAAQDLWLELQELSKKH